MDEAAPKSEVPRRFRLGPYEVVRRPRKRGSRKFAVSAVVLLIGMASILFHEVTYHAYSGGGHLIFGLVSHAGADLILMLIVIVLGALYAESRK